MPLSSPPFFAKESAAPRDYVAAGAHPGPSGVTYCVWAPERSELRVAIGEGDHDLRYFDLEKTRSGYFVGRDEEGRAGDLYRFDLDGVLTPDPASRYQPQGVFGPSQVVDPASYRWQTRDWKRPPLKGRVIYELHVGAATPEGTFRGLISRLDALADLGVNTLELMPLADFPGARNWGYDGVMLFAPARCYGEPDDLRALVDAAHQRGLAVILDVVYNHLGPNGNVLPAFCRHYFHGTRASSWGQGLNFDGEHCGPVRDFYLQNACQWLDEYRLDGLRLDSVHSVVDHTRPHIFAAITAAAHARGAFVVAEDERNDVTALQPAAQGGWGLDGVWADDFHNTIRVAFTGQRESHFGSFHGTLDEWVETLDRGWYYRGQFYPHWKRSRGTDAAHLSPERFIMCISNHDQVGNRPLGDRLHHTLELERYRAVSLLLCLMPYTPMLFMGQEWATARPFLFFTDQPGEVGERMAYYRQQEFARYGTHPGHATIARMPDPQAEKTFLDSKLDWHEHDRSPHREVLALYRAALRQRAAEPIFQSPPRSQWSVAKIGAGMLGLRWKDPGGDWLLLLSIAPPAQWPAEGALMKPHPGREWKLILDSNDARFGGDAKQPTLHGHLHGLVLTSPGAVLLREI